jgi:ribonuclease J
MVKIEVLGGHREIGGNCVKVTDKDRVILFDQGLRFSIFKRYYSRLIQPIGLPELRKLSIIPSPEAYEDVNTIYVSHLHLDHLGLLSNIPGEIIVKLPSHNVYKVLEEGWKMSPSWPVFIPPRFFVKTDEATRYKTDENDVLAVPVLHSAYPANAYIYFGSEETILYTGDLRINSTSDIYQDLYGKTLLNYIEENRDIKIDKLIIEGTNIGRLLTPIKVAEAHRILERLVEEDKITFMALHELDIESLLLASSLRTSHGKKLVIASSRLTKVIETLISDTPSIKRTLKESIALEDEVKHSTIFIKTSMDEIKRNPSAYCIITDIGRLDEILRKFEPLSQNLTMAPAILMIAEPSDEEATFDEARLINWLSLYGLQPYNLRISGHYHPYELKTIIQTIKPKEVIPIHTLNPEYLYALSMSNLEH